MSGVRPHTSGVYHNSDPWQPHIGPELTLTTQFLKAGYDVYGAGKIYHNHAHRDSEWTEYFKETPVKLNRHPSAKDNGVDGITFSALSNPDEDMPDYKVVDYGIDKLKSKREKPFFLAIGFVKPHMSWSVPKKYYDQFPLDSIQLPPTQANDLSDVPEAGVKIAKPNGDHAAMVKSGRWKEAVQAYLATISFMDGQLGRLMKALDESPHKNNTIIVFWGDHGWHLGEKEHWRKFALWEEATRAPLIFVAPGVTQPNGLCTRTVDFMSIYPTLCDLSGIAIPQHVEGKSIKSLLENPKAPWSTPALTTHGYKNHALRSEGWRYIRYEDGSEELYDETSDPYEWKNVSQDASQQATKKSLAEQLPVKDHEPFKPGAPINKNGKNNKQGGNKKAKGKE